MIKRIINGLKVEERRAKEADRLDDLKETRSKLATIRRLWRKFGTDPLVKQMEIVVLEHVLSKHMDFYYHDLSMMEKLGDTPFCWLVRISGTNLIRMEGDEEAIRDAQEWFQLLRNQFGEGGKVSHKTRLYIIDPKKKTMKKMKLYSAVKFKVIH